MIFDASESIRYVEHLPVRCDHCAYESALSDRSASLDAALIEASELHSLEKELLLQRRLQKLASSVPEAAQRFVSSSDVRRAPDLQDALRADPELHDFLRHSSFRLLRHQLIESLVSERRASLPVNLVTCPSCQQGMIYIEEKFYDHLGMDRSYLKRKVGGEKK